MKKSVITTMAVCIGCILSSCGNGGGQNKQSETMTGNDKDAHGCIASAGYTWSEVKKECIRPWEAGVKMEDLKSAEQDTTVRFAAYLVFSKDSSKAEAFVFDRKSYILRRETKEGIEQWTDGTITARQVSGLWTVSKGDEILYCQVSKKNN